MADNKVKITYFVQCCFCEYKKQIMSSSTNKMYLIKKLFPGFRSVKVHMGRKHKAEIEYYKYMMPDLFNNKGSGVTKHVKA